MLSLALLVCCLGALVSSAPGVFYDIEEAETHFEGFMNTYKKNYSSEQEKKMRFEIFKQNLKLINQRNEKESLAVHGITQFSDMTQAEFKSMYLGLRKPEGPSPCKPKLAKQLDYAAPDKFDWRDNNVITRVKSQGACGSCWAFSTIGNLESRYAIQTGKLVEFSESQLVECDKTNDACHGGAMFMAMLYVKNAGGIMTEKDYPYNVRPRECAFDINKVAAKVVNCTSYEFESEDEMRDTLVDVGPLSIAVDADLWLSYKGGILTDCEAGDINHGALLVGYGVENDTPYWIIKNSWGEGWGESGYIRLKRNINACTIMTSKMISSADMA